MRALFLAIGLFVVNMPSTMNDEIRYMNGGIPRAARLTLQGGI